MNFKVSVQTSFPIRDLDDLLDERRAKCYTNGPMRGLDDSKNVDP